MYVLYEYEYEYSNIPHHHHHHHHHHQKEIIGRVVFNSTRRDSSYIDKNVPVSRSAYVVVVVVKKNTKGTRVPIGGRDGSGLVGSGLVGSGRVGVGKRNRLSNFFLKFFNFTSR